MKKFLKCFLDKHEALLKLNEKISFKKEIIQRLEKELDEKNSELSGAKSSHQAQLDQLKRSNESSK